MYMYIHVHAWFHLENLLRGAIQKKRNIWGGDAKIVRYFPTCLYTCLRIVNLELLRIVKNC